ncbi:hypothetical protein [Streptomyces jumonjinensis]|uniref:hypothetical protein n=1 Tax=Streptomyces jumonjinensis TaxID=1945 RepID=UPI00379B8474
MNTADKLAIALHHTGQKLAGQKGIAAAKAVSAAVLGRHLEPCTGDACDHCTPPRDHSPS